MEATKILAWHFVGDTLRDGRPVPADGEVLKHEGDMEMCVSGLHASMKCVDAFQYAPGHTLCRVECSGDIEYADDKMICRERVILSRIDARPLLRAWARWCALQIIHLWDMPNVVCEYLTTGDESKRVAAKDVSWLAARDATRDDAMDAAWITAETAAREAASAAASTADSVAAWDAAKDAASAAARDAQSKQLDIMAEEAINGCTEWVLEVPERGTDDNAEESSDG